MLGHYGWIRSLQEIDSPEVHRHWGHIYLKARDIRPGAALTPGCKVVFFLYADADGLGAEDCQPASDVPAELLVSDGKASADSRTWSDSSKWHRPSRWSHEDGWSSSQSWASERNEVSDGLRRSSEAWCPSWKSKSANPSELASSTDAMQWFANPATSLWVHNIESDDHSDDDYTQKFSVGSTSAGESSDSETESHCLPRPSGMDALLDQLGVSAPPGLDPPDLINLPQQIYVPQLAC